MNTELWLEEVQAGNRFGVKGPRAAELLRQCGFAVPAIPNTWAALPARDEASSIVARLGNTEFFIEEQGDAPGIAALSKRLENQPGAWPALREDFAMRLGGARAAEALAEVCNVNFAALPLAQHTVVMTLMAGVAVLVLPQLTAAGPVYRIWCDPSFGPYLWETLADVSRAGLTNNNGRVA
jgi:sarcosine oxidase subunit gamma